MRISYNKLVQSYIYTVNIREMLCDDRTAVWNDYRSCAGFSTSKFYSFGGSVNISLGIEESVCKVRDVAWFCKIPTGFASVQSYENEQPWVICLCTQGKTAKI